MFVLVTFFGLVVSCSNAPSKDKIKKAVVEQIEVEGGQDLRFELFEIITLEPNQDKKYWRASVRMKGTYTQNFYPKNKTYNFDLTRGYEIHRVSGKEWKSIVVGMNKLYQEEGSRAVSQ